MSDTEVKIEEWENCTRSKQGIVRVREGREEMEWLRGGQTFLISPDERRINQRKVALPAYDSFTNGSFRCKSGIDDADPDRDKLIARPDVLTDREIDKLLDGPMAAFESAVVQMTSETTLRRILERADGEGAASARLNLLRDRLQGLDRRSPMKGDQVSDGDPELERVAPQMSAGEDDGLPGPRRYAIDEELAND